MSEASVNIIGVGNTLIGDDGVGPAVAEALDGRALPEGVCVYDAGLGVSDVLGGLDPEIPLIVIDALRAGGRPGSIYKASMDELSLVEGTLSGCLSLHEISVLPALRIEAMTGREFRNVTVFGVEPESAGWGDGLSPAAAAAVESLADAVVEHIETVLALMSPGV
ncbi:MAG: hydrogenase maturation protease [Planctomycetes bacterium]|nr:hydrogenase maturation protease [Planctomycetota bacterium]